jgi:hypothetical protein
MGDVKLGDRIEWQHLFPDGDRIARSGTVWGEAPIVSGCSSAWWVIPDEPMPSDLYSALLVGRCNAPKREDVGRGALFSNNAPSSPTGGMTQYAAQHARLTRSGMVFRAYKMGFVR